MAERLYVWSINKYPEPGDTLKKLKAKGIMEFNYGFPVSAKILMSAKFVGKIPSLLLEGVSCALSDFQYGAKAFFEFGKFIKFVSQEYEGETGYRGFPLDVEKGVNEAVAFLTKQRAKFLIFEFGELASMQVDVRTEKEKTDKIVDDYILEALTEYKKVYLPIIKFQSRGKPNYKKALKLLKSLKATADAEMLGLWEFTSTLYYSY